MTDTDEIYDLTDGGLQIFEYLLGDDLCRARRSPAATKISFRIGGEKNASAGLVRSQTGLWYLTVFNDDAVPRRAIDYWMFVRNTDFGQALRQIPAEMGLPLQSGAVALSQPMVTFRRAGEDTPEDYYEIDRMKGFTEKGLEVLGGLVQPEVCHRYRMYQIKSFTRREGDRLVTKTATDDYPMFAIMYDKWAKVYQPLSAEKGGRFRYCGKKPATHLFGLETVEAMYEKLNEQEEPTTDAEGATQLKLHQEQKLEHVFIMSGDRDAMNMAGAGFPVVWRNSESEPISEYTFQQLRKYAKVVINVPDIDDEGIRYANALAEKYLELRTLWLPSAVRERSYRGKPGKDFRDWVGMQDLKVSRYTPAEDRQKELERKRGAAIRTIREMVKTAYPMQFWEEYTDTKGRTFYSLSPTYAFYFLRCRGFGIIHAEDARGGYQTVYMKDNVVRKAEVAEMRMEMNRFAEARRLPIALRDAIMKTKLITGETTFNMKELAPDFCKAGPGYQWMFFRNAAWKITPEKIEQYRRIPDGICAWEDTICPREVTLREDSPFEIVWDQEEERYDIRILDKASNYFKILINTSRVHWAAEGVGIEDLEERQRYFDENRFEIAGRGLSEEQVAEQKQHLVNKIFAIGYLMHSYKDLGRTWAVFAMDNRIGNGRDSNGRSGKSLVFKFLKQFVKWYSEEGRKSELTKEKHLFMGVNKYTDVVMVDDADRNLDFDYFFSKITGDMTVNPKGLPPYTIPFEESPKFVFTSNYTIKNEDPSTSARLLYTVFSDWYHGKVEDDEYETEHKVMDDFGGRTLFGDGYGAAEWNEDINFLAYCVRFYLSTVTQVDQEPGRQKVNPPMSNVKVRQILSRIDSNFMDWADTYIVDRLGQKIIRNVMVADFLANGGFNVGKTTPHRFKKNLLAWVKFRGYELNPGTGSHDGRIVERDPITGCSVEYILVKNAEE